FGAVIVIGVSVLSVFFSAIEESPDEPAAQTQESQSIDKSKFRKSPGLVGITGYLNTTP
ncbi:MAG: thiol-disulfide isomerase, partial [Nitrosopumilaceae archaeon]|nr:thiol-disulfide isomerase [Nitrosopumilaceae archaeon]NIU00004.1 thiol-disulfide isomerase [Nitrosopumilaceae archaeon]NIU86377.1 thiol-disulfide isomerase [Nitrosopumilaceae archaeon]NIV65100.1 thiol-disulfide isomerase [Nitrosopumilaceae archaeon]NIX60606.1 thiol-disulfide isomerase [Nitrosopumilaceae archaeon]